MRSFSSSFDHPLYHLSFIVHSRPHPPCCIACHHFSPVTLHNVGFLCQAITLIIDPITSTFLGDFSFRIGHASSGEYISMARRLLLFPFTTYSRSSPFIIAQAGVEASLIFPLVFHLYSPYIYPVVCWRPSSQSFADFLHVARCSYRETP